MKTIGLIGGLSWISSRDYYSILNLEYNQKTGGSHSCPIIMYSFDFGEMEALQQEGNWVRLSELMSEAAIKVEKGGAELVMICSNTMHYCLDAMQARIMIPILHIADAAGKEINNSGITRVGLMGTKYLMQMSFYHEILRSRYSVDTIFPEDAETDDVNEIIYNELTRGLISGKSKDRLREIIDHLAKKGAQGILLACTELPLIIDEIKTDIPLLNSARIHALYGLEYAMKEHLYA